MGLTAHGNYLWIFQFLASASGSGGLSTSQICIWDLQQMVCKTTLSYHEHDVVCMDYSRDDRFLISVGKAGFTCIQWFWWSFDVDLTLPYEVRQRLLSGINVVYRGLLLYMISRMKSCWLFALSDIFNLLYKPPGFQNLASSDTKFNQLHFSLVDVCTLYSAFQRFLRRCSLSFFLLLL